MAVFGRRTAATLLPPGRPTIMGVINATPDSFWSGSRYPDPEQAARAAVGLVAAGADVLDIGAVSSRPGASPVDEGEELARLLPVLVAVRQAVRVPLSVDTGRAAVARAALAEGADWINDVTGLSDPRMADVLAAQRCPVVLADTHALPGSASGLDAVGSALEALLERAIARGIHRASIVLDPGFGFGKSVSQNLELVAGLPQLRRRLAVPLCVGPSRKGTVSTVLGGRPTDERLPGTAALVALCAAYGADVIRVHDVPEMADVAAVAAAVGPPLEPRELGRVVVRGLRIEGRHGVLPDEYERSQPFVVDLELEMDLRRAGTDDRLESTVNYAEAAAEAAEVLRGPHRQLIERLAEEIVARILARFPLVQAGRVTVHKPQAPVGLPVEDVAVCVPFRRVSGGPAVEGATGP